MAAGASEALGASRASMDYRAMLSDGPGPDSARRQNTLEESMRKTAGKAAVEFYAARNPAINTAKTKFNVDMVNDGNGGFRTAISIDEVVAYGDARVGRLSKKLKPHRFENGKERGGERHALTIVGQAPWGLLEPDGTTYHPLGKDGLPRDGQDGRDLVELPRYRAKDPAELMRYFENYIQAQAAILPGGRDAIHGYSINMDETRPHIQILADPFEANERGKEPDALKNGFSRGFGSHRSDTLVMRKDKAGVMREMREGASGKMSRYHDELKAHMLAAGFDIEAERDERRHDRRLDLPDFKEVEHQKQFISEDVEVIAEMRELAALEMESAADAHAGVVGREAETAARIKASIAAVNRSIHAVNDDRRAVDADRVTLDAERAEWREVERPRLVSAAKAEGRDAGRAEGEAEAASLVDDARTERANAATAAAAAVADQRAAREALERIEQRDQEAAEHADEQRRAVETARDEAVAAIKSAANDAIADMPTPAIDDMSVGYVAAAKAWKLKSGRTAHDELSDRALTWARQQAASRGGDVGEYVRRTIGEQRERSAAASARIDATLNDLHGDARTTGRGHDQGNDGASM
ncbi:hypothetical protein [Tsukamurella pseudospumae]|uniref:Uncharacterized protein n=1 Tax=Tsukamurella pseudospumae TaxID=239498 RepID=A0A137YWX6_9ACTN|nr:hypothetical protein [Tsukamurella pseudospumae]KXO90456.1 hypothetical protein AXK61_07505 [Tsukamurella pseudospumae]